ncbi:MAG: SDR family NAD(P)-dependent oxidoreductase [Oscillospiraceae bacterium]|nr:SDR family NAD(P)-dependent oxidoreductase [Oscillospiraceae bacterium]
MKGIAVITGASAGIGREFVFSVDRRYEFDEIWVIARREERLEELAPNCRNRIRPVVMDLTDNVSFDRYRDMLESEKPDIRMLINSAGCGVFGPFEEKDLEKLTGSIQLNSVALTAICHISLPYMKEGSCIINVGSNSSWQPVPYQAVYGASKSYVLSFSRAIGRELRPRGIHVMCVCPGWIRTEFQEYAHHDEYIRYVDKWYGPDEVAEQAMKDLEKLKDVSILGAPVRRQVRLVKHLPVDLVMDIWCRQQGFDTTDKRKPFGK